MSTKTYLSGAALRINFPPPPPSTLCQLCRALGDWFALSWISKTQHRRSLYQHHLTWDALFESASKGCSFCYQLALEGEERAMGGTIAHKIQHGKPTAFTAEMDGERAQVSVRCDKLQWCFLDVYVVASESANLLHS